LVRSLDWEVAKGPLWKNEEEEEELTNLANEEFMSHDDLTTENTDGASLEQRR